MARCFFFIVSSLICSIASAKFQILEEVLSVSAGDSVYVVVDELPATSTISLLEKGSVLAQQSLGLRRGLGAVFFIEPESKQRNLTVQVKYNFGTAKEQPASISVVESPEGIIAKDALRSYSKLLGENQKDIRALATSMDAIIGVLDPKTISITQARLYLLSSLYGAGKFAEVKTKAEGFLAKENAWSSSNQTFEYLQILEFVVRADKALNPYDASYEDYLNLMDEFAQFESSSSIYQQLYVQDVKASYGNLVLQYGRKNDDLNNSRKHHGASIIKSASKKAKELQDDLTVAEYKNYLWSYHFMIGEFAEAERLFEEAIATMQDFDARAQLIDIYHNYSVFLSFRGDYAGALKYLQLTLRDSVNINEVVRADLLLNLSELAHLAGNYDIASINAEKAVALFSKIGNLGRVGSSALLAGKAYREQKRYSKAIAAHKLAVTAFSQNDSEGKNFSLDARTELVVSLIEGGNLDDANAELKELNFLIDSPDSKFFFREEILRIELELARLMLPIKLGDQDGFEKHSKNLRTIFSKSENKGAYKIEQLLFMRQILEWQKAQNDLSGMTETIARVLALVESVRSQFDTKVLGPAWSSKVAEVFELYATTIANVALKEDRREILQELFMFLEKTQSVSFRQSRSIVRHQLGSIDLKELREEEISLITMKDEGRKVESLQKMTELQMKNLAAAQEIKSSELPIISIESLQNQLDSNELFISYAVMQPFSMAFVISQRNWQAFRLPAREDLALSAVSFQKGLLKKSALAAVESNQLLELLKIPLGLNNIDRITIRLDGPLWAIPIGALNASESKNHYAPLTNTHDIVTTHSASEYFHSRIYNLPKDGRNDIAIFADPIFEKASLGIEENPLSDGERFRNWTANLARLPWTAQESRSIQNIFNSKKVFAVSGSDATARALLSRQMLDARVLHIASHGYFSEKTPDVVGIATAYTEDSAASGFVSLSQFSSTPIFSNLVVISGCETSLGKEFAGEGFNGLTRGVLGQGAGSVIGTLWSIPDKPSADFMKLFYRYLKESNGDAVSSISKVKREFANGGDYQSPYYWAGFVLTGADRKKLLNVFID